jgi:hypothetical protein
MEQSIGFHLNELPRFSCWLTDMLDPRVVMQHASGPECTAWVENYRPQVEKLSLVTYNEVESDTNPTYMHRISSIKTYL